MLEATKLVRWEARIWTQIMYLGCAINFCEDCIIPSVPDVKQNVEYFVRSYQVIFILRLQVPSDPILSHLLVLNMAKHHKQHSYDSASHLRGEHEKLLHEYINRIIRKFFKLSLISPYGPSHFDFTLWEGASGSFICVRFCNFRRTYWNKCSKMPL